MKTGKLVGSIVTYFSKVGYSNEIQTISAGVVRSEKSTILQVDPIYGSVSATTKKGVINIYPPSEKHRVIAICKRSSDIKKKAYDMTVVINKEAQERINHIAREGE